jgi:hypothetical protein
MRLSWSQPPIVDPANVAITGGTGVEILIAQSFVAVSAPADATEDTLATIAVPANTLGANGCLIIEAGILLSGAASARNFNIKFGGTTFAAYSSA